MGIKFRAFVAGAMACGFASFAQAQTLTDTLISAYQNSDLLEQNRALLRAADEDVAQATAALRPIVAFTANASNTANSGPDAGSSSFLRMSASLDLYDGGQNRLALQGAKEGVLSTRASLLGLEQDVLLGAVQAHMEMLSATENVALSQSNVRLIQQELRAAKDRFEVGEVTRTDVSIAEAALAAARSNLVAAEGALVAARESYKLAVGRYPANISANLRTPSLPENLNAAREIAQRTHPDIIAAQHRVTVAELNHARAQAARGPTVTAGAALTQTDEGTYSRSVELELNQTLYAGGQLLALKRRAANVRESERAALLRAVKLIDQEVANAWSNLAVARAQLVASEEQIRAAQLAFDGTKEEAKLGSRTTLDVLDAEQDLLDARASRIDAGVNQYVAIYSVLSAMGLLTVDHLNLGIPTYDPKAYYSAVKSAPVSAQGASLDRVLKSIGAE